MLTDYERYQLEWMIEHGHSLKEFVQGLDLVDRDGIDSLEDAYAIWENDYGFGGEVFSNEREFKEEDLPEIMRKPEHETEMGRILKKGGALYSPERGIVIASYLKEEVSPRIEVYYGYPPYVLASLVGRNFGVTVDSSIMDIQDALADPSLPRRLDHELADFASVDEFMSSRFPNSATDWLDVSGNTGLEDMLQLLDIKQTDNVREWYMLAFPDDELVTGINPRLTFVDAIAAVPTGDTLNGKLYSKSTGKPLMVGDKPVTGQTTFTPEKADGKVEVTFTFDSRTIADKTDIVVFESLVRSGTELASQRCHRPPRRRDQGHRGVRGHVQERGRG